MQKESRQKSQTVPNAAPQRAATMGSRWRFRVNLGPCGPRAVGPRSGRFATFVAIPFACWASGGTKARCAPRTVSSIGLIHSNLRLIHSLTTVEHCVTSSLTNASCVHVAYVCCGTSQLTAAHCGSPQHIAAHRGNVHILSLCVLAL